MSDHSLKTEPSTKRIGREWLALLLTALAFICTNNLLSRLYRWLDVDLGMVVLVLVTVLAVLASRQVNIRSPARIMAFGCSAILGLYAVLLVPGFAPDPQFGSTDNLHGLWRWLAVAAVPFCWRWPGFGVFPAGFVMLYKAALAQHTGLTISPTDYLPVVELGLFLSLGLSIGNAFIAPVDKRRRYFEWVFLAAVAVHIANYFWSGIAKIILTEDPLYWLINNDTSNIVLVSHLLGTLPVTGETAVTLAHLVRDNVFVLNLLTLGLQLLAPLALLSRRSLIGFTLAFDVSHIVIFLCSGIFFWKWILLNLVIVAAAGQAVFKRLDWTQHLLLPLVVLFGNEVFFTAKLGWLDTPSATVSFVEAEFSDGIRLRLPSNAFLASSVTAAQIRLVRPLSPTNGAETWGQTSEAALFERVSNDCLSSEIPSVDNTDSSPAKLAETAALVERYVTWQRSRQGPNALIGASHWYPHHIFSNPVRTPAVNLRRWSEIKALRYVSELHCVGLADEGITSSIIASQTSPLVEFFSHDEY